MAEKPDWLEQLTAPLPEDKIRSRLSDDNQHWAFIDSEMVRLGALSHGSLNLAEIQQRILGLLAAESKDFRLVAHLLRTLQHGGQPQEIILALQLLCAWVREYWRLAWPEKAAVKRRLAQQVIKRFASAAQGFCERADDEQRQEVLGELAHLAQLWQAEEKDLAQEADALGAAYRRRPERRPTIAETESENLPQLAVSAPATAVAPTLTIDESGDKAWRQTQLRMAGILCARQPDNPLGYCLRRNAIWESISSAPQPQADGRTPLAAFSADRMAEYLSEAAQPDLSLWQQVEESLTLAPYWFEGHRLSADIAQRLGYKRVAGAIREELQLFLQRLPQLGELSFNDRTPFLSDAAREWLSGSSEAAAVPSAQTGIDKETIWQRWQQQGLEAALAAIDETAQKQGPRGRFYCQLLGARLLQEAGLTALAQQSYRHLSLVARGITLADWEPDLIMQLEQQLNGKG